jgi:hypothetical protein
MVAGVAEARWHLCWASARLAKHFIGTTACGLTRAYAGLPPSSAFLPPLKDAGYGREHGEDEWHLAAPPCIHCIVRTYPCPTHRTHVETRRGNN